MKKAKKKGKAIIGIAMAAIMLASVMVAMVLTGSAQPLPMSSYNGLYNNISLNETGVPKPAAVSVLIGQELHLWATARAGNATVLIRGDPTSATVSGEIFTSTTGYFDTAAMTKPGIYYANATGGSPTSEPDRWDAKLAVTNPVMTIDLKSSGTSVSSITVGTHLQIDFTNNLDGSDMVSLVITDPDGNTIKQTTNPTQYFDKINVSYLTTRYGGFTGTTTINTTGWKLGTYKFKSCNQKECHRWSGCTGVGDEQ